MRVLKFFACFTIVAVFFFGTLYVLDSQSTMPAQARVEGITLKPPFTRLEGSKVAWQSPAPPLEDFSDAPGFPERSPYLMFEGDKQMGPPHSSYAAVTTEGKGQFLHWTGYGFIFSASDNSDPNKNGRTYRVVRAP
jgi:hypothetical protein